MGHQHASEPRGAAERRSAQRRLQIALGIALAVLVMEIVGAIVSNSLALAADAGHVLGDAAAVALALGAIWLAGRPGGARRTFGWYRAEIMAAALNGGVLLVIAALLIWRAVGRIGEDPDIEGLPLLAVALAGLVANLVSARLLHRSQRHNFNVRGAYYHVLGDTLGSVAALSAGIVVLATGWVAADLIASLAIAALIIVGALRLLAEAIDVLLEAAPPGLDVAAVEAEVAAVPGVLGVHDLHLWTVTSGFVSLSAHVDIADDTDPTEVLVPVAERLQARFGLVHLTLQPETARLHEAMECCHFLDHPRLADVATGDGG